MEKITVRRAKNSESKAVSELITRSMRHAYRDFVNWEYLAALRGDAWIPLILDETAFTCLIAEKRSSPIGTAIIRAGAIPELNLTGELSALYVEPGHLYRGVGKALVKGATTLMRGVGLNGCILNVLADNNRAIEFYKRRGFVMLNCTYDKKLGAASYKIKYMKKIL